MLLAWRGNLATLGIRPLTDAELAQRSEAACLEHADLLARILQHIVAYRLGKEAARRSIAAR